ncbi:MAG TPA: metal-dependent hydrolase [Gammaproteobacteria bacterium]|nr:metal-dependent hydrolase [Gammaproteobacteria bacterium]
MSETQSNERIRPEIERRDLRFDIDERLPRHWHGGDPYISRFFDGLSIMFPEGERFFIDSVRHYRNRIEDPKLLEQVRGFIGQEAMHSREHKEYNDNLQAQGLRAEVLEGRVRKLLGFVRRHVPHREQLAATCALEHFTAILADVALRDPEVLADVDPVYHALWTWHAIEETEHKAVAFDVYKRMFPGWKGYVARVGTMAVTTAIFLERILRHHLYLLRQDGQSGNLRSFARCFRFFWIRPGYLRQMIPMYFSYYRPRFHPWQHDNRRYVEEWKASYDHDALQASRS